ncbi:MAG: hypothetical protein KBI41_03665 [Kiritimatiellae bacterium]|nr:hypothetical protein [Kiritimatiellia bacterium]
MSRERTDAKKGGCLRKVGIGCLTLVILLAVGGVLVYRTARSTVTRLAARYTDVAPTELPEFQMEEGEKRALFERVDGFVKAVKEGKSDQTLSLSARDINALIQNSPELAGRLFVEIEDERICGDVSFPLDQLSSLDLLKGRWLNGSVELSVNTVAGRLVVFMESLTVRGKPVPEQLMSAIRSRNLADQAFGSPKAAQILQRIEKVKVEDGRLVIESE